MEGMIGSIIMHKGGVGKSITVCNLGNALARAGKRVLVVDLDPQSNTTSILLSGDVRNSVYNLMNMDNDVKAEECIHTSKYKDLFIIPNIRKTATLEPKLFQDIPKSMSFLKNRIRQYAIENFDFTLLDNAPHLGVICVNSIITSDFIIIPNETGSLFSIDGLNDAVEFAQEIQESNKISIKFIKVLMTKVHKNYSAHKAAIAQIQNFFPYQNVFETTIPSNADIQKAEMVKKTVFAYRSNAIGAKAYQALAEELIDSIE